MSVEKEFDDIPEFIKKFVPAIMRGLSWAKYKEEKELGTSMKSEAFQDAYNKGVKAASVAPNGDAKEQIYNEITETMWAKVHKLTDEAKEISSKVNNQKSKEDREVVLGLAKDAARKAGLHAAIAAGWEKGWKYEIIEHESKNLD